MLRKPGGANVVLHVVDEALRTGCVIYRRIQQRDRIRGFGWILRCAQNDQRVLVSEIP